MPTSTVSIGVVGYGYWGPNVCRNFMTAQNANLVCVVDKLASRRKAAEANLPGVHVSDNFSELLNDKTIDAIAIVTPVESHFSLAMACLKAGKHVWVEKPLAATSQEAERLLAEADRQGKLIHVDHTFVYTGAVRKLKELIDQDALGRLYYYDSIRVNLGLFTDDVDVLWDLAVHDISILSYLISTPPTAVSAQGVAHFEGRRANTAFMTLYYPDNFVAHINANWLSPIKIRQTLLAGEKKMAVYNDLDPVEKVKIFDSGVQMSGDKSEVYNTNVDYRVGDIWVPKLSIREALSLETEHFVDCIINNKKSETDGLAGLDTVRILEATSKSLAANGVPQEI